MITTMRQISEACGYSLASVSNALNGVGLTSDATRQTIIQTAMAIGYQHRAPLEPPRLTDAEIGWLAGIMDGEGCITISACPPSKHATHRTIQYRPHIAISMCHKPSIHRIGQLFGMGSSSVEIRNATPGHHDVYKWYAGSRQAIACVRLIRPCLVTKAEEADLLLEYGQLPNLRTGRAGIPVELLQARHNIYEKMKALKHRNRPDGTIYD